MSNAQMSIHSCLSCTRVCSQGSLPGLPSVNQLGKVVGGGPGAFPLGRAPDQPRALFLAEHCHLEAPGPQRSGPRSSPPPPQPPNNGARVSGVLSCLLGALLGQSWKRPCKTPYVKIFTEILWAHVS